MPGCSADRLADYISKGGDEQERKGVRGLSPLIKVVIRENILFLNGTLLQLEIVSSVEHIAACDCWEVRSFIEQMCCSYCECSCLDDRIVYLLLFQTAMGIHHLVTWIHFRFFPADGGHVGTNINFLEIS